MPEVHEVAEETSHITDEHGAGAPARVGKQQEGGWPVCNVVGSCADRGARQMARDARRAAQPSAGAIEPRRGRPGQRHALEECGGDALPQAHVQGTPQTRAEHMVTEVVGAARTTADTIRRPHNQAKTLKCANTIRAEAAHQWEPSAERLFAPALGMTMFVLCFTLTLTKAILCNTPRSALPALKSSNVDVEMGSWRGEAARAASWRKPRQPPQADRNGVATSSGWV